jgi:hypothetical protein
MPVLQIDAGFSPCNGVLPFKENPAMRFLAAALPVAALLLSPLTAPAQTPPAKVVPQKVSIQVTFVTVDTDDLDALGINFGLVPLPTFPRTFFVCAAGNVAPELYQTLTQTATHIGSHTISLTPITVSDNVPAVFTVNTQMPNVNALTAVSKERSSFPQLTGSGQLRGKITLIPQIMPGNLVRLDMLSPRGSNQRVLLYYIPSGQQVVINTAVVKEQPMAGPVQIGGISGHSKVAHTTELLIFVTPTVVCEAAPVIETTFVPPIHFLGAAVGNPLSDNTFGNSVPSNNGDASSGFLGFGMTKPSDILRPMSDLDFSHWQSRSRRNGTINRPGRVIKTPHLPSGVSWVYAQ